MARFCVCLAIVYEFRVPGTWDEALLDDILSDGLFRRPESVCSTLITNSSGVTQALLFWLFWLDESLPFFMDFPSPNRIGIGHLLHFRNVMLC